MKGKQIVMGVLDPRIHVSAISCNRWPWVAGLMRIMTVKYHLVGYRS